MRHRCDNCQWYNPRFYIFADEPVEGSEGKCVRVFSMPVKTRTIKKKTVLGWAKCKHWVEAG